MARSPATRRLDRIALVLVALPLAAWGLAIAITLALAESGCTINAAGAHPCQVAGLDLAELAYTSGFFAAWGGLIVLPVSGGLAVLWAVTRLLLVFALPRSDKET